MLEGELVDSDGTVLREGDCVSYAPGTRHRTHSPKGCTLLAGIKGPISTIEGDDELETMREGRKIVNWHDGGFVPYPSLPDDSEGDPVAAGAGECRNRGGILSDQLRTWRPARRCTSIPTSRSLPCSREP